MWTDNNEAVQITILPPVEKLSVFFGLRMFYEGIKMEINKRNVIMGVVFLGFGIFRHLCTWWIFLPCINKINK